LDKNQRWTAAIYESTEENSAEENKAVPVVKVFVFH
jgi:hypothetical protein